jgi:hypothetical protein
LSYDGQWARLEEVPAVGLRSPRGAAPGGIGVLGMFDVAGVEGPVCLDNYGTLYHTTGDVRVIFSELPPRASRLVAATRDGRQVALADAGNSRAEPRSIRIVQTRDGATQACWSHDPLDQMEGFSRLVKPVSLRWRFSEIYVSSDGMLTLVSSKRRQASIACDRSRQRLHWVARSGTADSRQPKRILWQNIDPPPGVGFSLKVARWDDGSQAWLDSRGLLHLKSADPEIPQCTLVLRDGELACWCDDGRYCGPDYFAGDVALRVSASEVYDQVIRPFLALLPC